VIQDPSKSSFGLEPNVAAGLAALFGWVGGLVILLGKPAQGWVRFVAVQSIVLSIGFIVLYIALTIVSVMLTIIHLGILGLILFPVEMLLGLGWFIATIVTTISGFQGKATRLPIVADYADRYVPASMQL
jgi:uncharacterized membrane protein